jgi:hypothetical protein
MTITLVPGRTPLQALHEALGHRPSSEDMVISWDLTNRNDDFSAGFF